ncbi:MAG: hypothetical protein SF052_17255 [Bacteroidia bacterium]|nr:hypothetical protein [Bacteroidia bacterium]
MIDTLCIAERKTFHGDAGTQFLQIGDYQYNIRKRLYPNLSPLPFTPGSKKFAILKPGIVL